MLNRQNRLSGVADIRSQTLAVVGLALLLRIWSLGQDLWWDEENVVDIVAEYSFLELVWAVPANQPHFPSYYLLIDAWTQLGFSVLSGRIFSLVGGTIAVLATLRLGQRWFSDRVGVVAGLLIGLSPVMVIQSGWLRMYGLLAGSAAISWLALDIAQSSSSRKYWALWSAAISAAVFLHPFGFFLVAAQAFVLFGAEESPDVQSLVLPTIAMVVGAVTILQKLTTRGGQPTELKHLSSAPTLADVVATPIALLIGRFGSWIQIAVAVVILTVALGKIGSGHQPRMELLSWFSVPLIGAVVVSHVLSPIFQLKYLVIVAPAVALLLADILDDWGWRIQATVLSAILFTAIAVIAFGETPWFALRALP